MKYIFSVVKRRIIKNKKTNILIFFQMMIGIILLSFFLNVNHYISNKYHEYIISNENNNFKIYTQPNCDATTPPISLLQENALDDYLQNYFSLDVYVDVITFNGISHMNADGEMIVDRYVINYNSEVEQICAEEEFMRAISGATESNTVNFNQIPFKISENIISFKDKKDIPVDIYEDADKNTHTIKIPIYYYYKYCNDNNFSDFFVNIKFTNEKTETVNKILYETESILESLNSEYDYILSSDFFDFIYHSSFDSNQAFLFSIISVLLIGIVYIGMISFFIMLIEKRKFEISVCFALGAKKIDILIEFAFEFFTISLTPTLISIMMLNLFLSKGFAFININIPDINNFINLLILISVILVNFLCLLPIFLMIHKLKPQEILQKH